MKLLLVLMLIVTSSISFADVKILPDTARSEERVTYVDVGLSALKVAGQFSGGFFSGILGAAVVNFHPVTAGLGWILGSSASVYLIGNFSGGKGNYWWTVISGAAPLIFFIIPLDQTNDSFSTGAVVLGAAVITLVTEIAGYYLTKPFERQNKNFGLENLFLPIKQNESGYNLRHGCPADVSLNLLHINF